MLARLIGRLLGREALRVHRGDEDSARDHRADAIAHRLQRGDALEHEGQLGAALACYREGASLYPDDAGAHVKIGNVLLELWRVDEAVTAYSKALQLESG